MRTFSARKMVLRCAVMLIVFLMVIAESGTTLALDIVRLNIVFDQTVATVGRTPLLTIDISSASGSPIRVTSLKCTSLDSHVLTSNSINPMPSTIPAGTVNGVGFVRTQQLYRANAPGNSQVTCYFTGVDPILGQVAATSNTVGVNVLSETRLYFDVTSASRTATVGQVISVIAKFGNRGKTAFTNLSLDCIDMGRGFFFISSTPTPSTILPGQSGFVEMRLQAVQKTTGMIVCNLTATDSSNGQQVTLPAPTLKIEVK
jgi:hypothetical protein